MSKKKEKNWYEGNVKPKIRKPKKKRIWLRVLLIVLAVMLLVAGGLALYLMKSIAELSPWSAFDTDEETLKLLAPFDDTKADAIKAKQGNPEDETWALYIYMVGSDLESRGLDELSPLTSLLVEDYAAGYSAEKSAARTEQVMQFYNEVTSDGLDLPKVLYQPMVKVGGASYEEAEYDPDAEGYASSDINEILDSDFPENCTVVIQTGGAKRWQNSLINPNRSQRFLLTADDAEMIDDAPIRNMGNPDTLADFLRFCNENYPADHMAVLFWNHGGATDGYGVDEIFGNDLLTLKELSSAFEAAVGKNEEDPYYDAIGFDACLMATIEVGHELYGYADVLYASEETEPGSGWDYSSILAALSENPGINAPQLGLVIADSFVESSISEYAEYGFVEPTTFSIIDLAECEEVYRAYCDYCGEALNRAASRPATLSQLSRAAQSSVAYAGAYYRAYNMIDLGMFMKESAAIGYNEKSAQAVLLAIDKAVLYTRASSYLSESTGLSVYFPARIEGLGGLNGLLDYINSVTDSEDIAALYYYKMAGCLNEELTRYAIDSGYGRVNPISYAPMDSITDAELKLSGDGNFSLQLTDEQLNLTQAVRFALVQYDSETENVIYLGEDGYAFLDEDGSVLTNFAGKWLALDGNLLPLEVVSETADNITFRTPVEYNNMGGWLLTGYNAETEEFSILGIREDMNASGGIISRNLVEIKPDSMLTIFYETGNLFSNASSQKSVVISDFNPGTPLEEISLPDGTYLEYLVAEDLRSDTYNSAVMSFTMENGKASAQAIEDSLYSYSKN